MQRHSLNLPLLSNTTKKRKGEEVGYIYLKDGLLWNMEEVVESGGMKRYTGM